MLAPVLARIEALPGVASARVDSSGRFFCVRLTHTAPERVVPLVRGVLGSGARLLTDEEAVAQLSGRERGDPWLAALEVVTLSYVEARLLSVRVAAEFARLAQAGAAERDLVAEALRRELSAAMERVHAEGGRQSSGWIYQEWPALSAAAVERCALRLSPALLERLAALLPSLLAR